MKTSRFPVLLLFLAFLFALAAPRARAQDDVSFDYFYDNLKPFGDWVQVGDYGLCWHPRDVAEDWAPYTDGYWAYTDAGWTWVSYEDFGDIVYHYGRWVRVEDEGWCWVPDNDWGPAWVSWRNNDEYVGWAPLPPEAHFRPEVGISVWADETYDIGPGYYQFCHTRDFGAPVIREVCLPRSRNIVFFRDTVNITNITIVTGYGIPFCGGPRYDFISTRVSRPIPALRLVRETNITNININVGGGRRSAFASVQRGNSLLMPAPRVRSIVDRNLPVPNVKPVRVLAANRVNHGWSEVQSPQERDQLRAVMKQQTKGATPETAPARVFSQADVKAVPQKADLSGPATIGNAGNRGPLKGKTLGNPGAPIAGENGRGPTATTGPGEDAAGTRGRQPVATPFNGKGKVSNGQTPTVVTPPVPNNPERAGGNPVTRVPQSPEGTITGNGGALHNQHTPMVVTPNNPNQGTRPVEEPRTAPVVSPQTAPAVPQRTAPVVPQRTAPTGNVPEQPFRGGGDSGAPRSGFKGGAVNSPNRTVPNQDDGSAARAEAAARAQSQRLQQEKAASQQAAVAQERSAAAAESRQRAAAAADARERVAAQQQAAAAAAARQQRAPQVQAVPQSIPQRAPQAVPQRPGAPGVGGTPVSNQDPRAKGKGKDKDDDKR